MSRQFGVNTKVLWNDRKRIWGMPITFTSYHLVEKENSWVKIFLTSGLLSTRCDEVNLFRVYDITVYRTLFDKMCGVGTLTLFCNMNNVSKIYLAKVKNPMAVRSMLNELIEIEKAKKGYRIAEFSN